MKDNSFSSLVAKLHEMSETDNTKTSKIKVIKKEKQQAKEKKHHDPEVNAMAHLLESIDETKSKKANHLLGKEKTKSVPAGETDGTTENPNRGKLVGEDKVDEDLIASLSNQFKDLLHPKTVEEDDVEEDIQDDRKYQSLEELRDKLVDIEKHIKRLGIMDSATEIQGKPVTGTADIHDQLTTMYKNIEGLQGAVARALKIVPGEQNPDIQKFNKKYGTTEAVGEFAEPIYQLCDELECPDNHPVFDELVRYMSGDQIKDFVADFRRHHDMNKD